MTAGGGFYSHLPLGMTARDREAFALSRPFYVGEPIGEEEIARQEAAWHERATK